MNYPVIIKILIIFLIFISWNRINSTFSQEEPSDINIGIVYSTLSCVGDLECSKIKKLSIRIAKQIESRLGEFRSNSLKISKPIKLGGNREQKREQLIKYALPSRSNQCTQNKPQPALNLTCKDKNFLFFVTVIKNLGAYGIKLQVKDISSADVNFSKWEEEASWDWHRFGALPIVSEENYNLNYFGLDDEDIEKIISINSTLAADIIFGRFHKLHPKVLGSKRVFYACLDPIVAENSPGQGLKTSLSRNIPLMTDNLEETAFHELAKEEDLQRYYILGPETNQEYRVFCALTIQERKGGKLDEENVADPELVKKHEIYLDTTHYRIAGEILIKTNPSEQEITIFLGRDLGTNDFKLRTLIIKIPFQGDPEELEFFPILGRLNSCITKYWFYSKNLVQITWVEDSNRCPDPEGGS